MNPQVEGVVARPRALLVRSVLAAVIAAAVVVALGIALRVPAESAVAPAADPRPGHGKASSRTGPKEIFAAGASEFQAVCKGSHVAGDDPVANFDQPGLSSRHQFIGNTSANATSTGALLRAGGTNCSPATDKSPYWVSALFKDGEDVPPETVTIYYQGITDGANAVAFPPGLKMIVGNATAATAADNPAARWNCLPGGASSRDFMNCPAGTKLQTYLDFPTCWNGKDLDSPDHISHMASPMGGGCPSTHPVAVPRLEFLITYAVSGAGLSLGGALDSTDAPGWTFHGGFWNVWDQAELQRRVKTCINGGIVCGTDGCPIGAPPCVASDRPSATPTPGGSSSPRPAKKRSPRSTPSRSASSPSEPAGT